LGRRSSALIEDGSLRAEMDAQIDPAWLAKYGDSSWAAALAVIGYGPQPGTPGAAGDGSGRAAKAGWRSERDEQPGCRRGRWRCVSQGPRNRRWVP